MKDQILREFAKRIKAERINRKLSQEELAERAGVHRTYIGMVERAEKNITLTTIQKLAKALSISISDLLKEL